VKWLIDLTQHNTRITAAVAFNYGGRAEVVAAARALVEDGLAAHEIDEEALQSRLFTREMPDPDLIIRTSGEARLSNFLIWQSAYSEYFITPVLWPDFGPDCLREAIVDFGLRERRFGATRAPERLQRSTLSVVVDHPAVWADDEPEPASFGTVEQAIADFAQGRIVLIVDDEDRENEGDLAIAANHVTPESINFMATHGRGLICMPMLGERLDHLRIPLMVEQEPGEMGTAFTLSVDARACGTGISATDRACTVRTLIDPETKPADLVKPGHLFPLRYAEGGLLTRRGHTEAAVDLARLAGCYPAAVICEVMNEDGTMARRDDLRTFSARHGISAVTVAQLADHLRYGFAV
jgi:3,4-dihydroxy-2-butanone 4-phosphate synthase